MAESRRKRLLRVREAKQVLWRRLCKAHRLTRRQRKVLKRAALDLGEDHPSVLFFLPTDLNRYMEASEGRLSSHQFEALRQAVETMFGESGSLHLEEGPLGDDGLPHRLVEGKLGPGQLLGCPGN